MRRKVIAGVVVLLVVAAFIPVADDLWLMVAYEKGNQGIMRYYQKAVSQLPGQEIVVPPQICWGCPEFDEEPSDGDALQARMVVAISKLPEKQRIVFNMRYYSEMSYEKISDVLGTSQGALKASYHHAVQKIKMYFSAEN